MSNNTFPGAGVALETYPATPHGIEILAPCGSADAVLAAARTGADAVYVGAERFSARASAENFNVEQLKAAIDYCHLHGVKLHLAINTLIRDDEMSDAFSCAVTAYRLGTDALIIQDLGLAAAVKSALPDCVLHASTQMSVCSPSGARLLQSMGFDRVVLARELTRDEIREITESCTVQTEVFVHGALCMCVSGQCLLSAMLGGRSGNRGRCAQPCRLPFSVKGGTGYDLSLKDNSIIDYLPELADIGVTSAKIEGRMKRPEYVAAAVTECGESSANSDTRQALRAVFSRSGFTDGYYTGKRGKSMFGTRTKEDVLAADAKTLSGLRTLYKDETRTNAVNMRLAVKENTAAVLTAECCGHTVTVEGDVPQKAKTAELTEKSAAARLAKTGGTAFYVKSITADIEKGLSLSAASLNSLRRQALDKLSEKICEVCRSAESASDTSVTSQYFSNIQIYKPSQSHVKYRASFRNCDIDDAFLECEYVYVPLFSGVDKLTGLLERGFNVAVEIPRIAFGMDKKISEKLREVRGLGIADAYCGSVGAAALAIECGLVVHGGYTMNIFNTKSLEVCENLGFADTEVSVELKATQINGMGGSIKRGVAGYGYLPLMIMRNCPNGNSVGKAHGISHKNVDDNAAGGCVHCGGRSTVTDRLGKKFTLVCGSGCAELLNTVPLNIADKAKSFGTADFITLRFTTETTRESVEIFRSFKAGEKPHGECTSGLYFRGVL